MRECINTPFISCTSTSAQCLLLPVCLLHFFRLSLTPVYFFDSKFICKYHLWLFFRNPCPKSLTDCQLTSLKKNLLWQQLSSIADQGCVWTDDPKLKPFTCWISAMPSQPVTPEHVEFLKWNFFNCGICYSPRKAEELINMLLQSSLSL